MTVPRKATISIFLIVLLICICAICLTFINKLDLYENDTSYDLLNNEWYIAGDLEEDPELKMLITDVSGIIREGDYILDISGKLSANNKDEKGIIYFDVYGDSYDPPSAEAQLEVFGAETNTYTEQFSFYVPRPVSNVYLRIFTRDNCRLYFDSVFLTYQPSLLKKFLLILRSLRSVQVSYEPASEPEADLSIYPVFRLNDTQYWERNMFTITPENDIKLKGDSQGNGWVHTLPLTFPTNTLYRLMLVFSQPSSNGPSHFAVDLYKSGTWDLPEHNWYMTATGIPETRQTNYFYFNTVNIPDSVLVRLIGKSRPALTIHRFSFEPAVREFDLDASSYYLDNTTLWDRIKHVKFNESGIILESGYSGIFLVKYLKLNKNCFYSLKCTMSSLENYNFDNTISIQVKGIGRSNESDALLRFKGRDIDRKSYTAETFFRTTERVFNPSIQVSGSLKNAVKIISISIEKTSAWRYWIQKLRLWNFRHSIMFTLLKVFLPAGLLALVFCLAPLHIPLNQKGVKWWALFILFTLLLVILLLYGFRSKSSIMSIELIWQFIFISVLRFICGWWIAVVLLPTRWQKYALLLSLPLGALILRAYFVILCWWLHVPILPASLMAIGFSLTGTIPVLIYSRWKTGFNRETLLPISVYIITFACLMGPMKNREYYGIYSNCMDGLTYCSTSTYAAELPDAEQKFNPEFIHAPKGIMVDRHRVGMGFALACYNTLLGIEPHDGYRMYHSTLHCLIPVVVFCILRLIFSAGLIASFIGALFSGLCPILAYALQNNSLSQSEGQVFLLLFILMVLGICTSQPERVIRYVTSYILVIIMLFVIYFTYWQVAFPYALLFAASIFTGWLCWKSKYFSFAFVILALTGIGLYICFRQQLINPLLLSEEIRKFVIPFQRVSGDIRILLGPWYAFGMFDIIRQTHTHAMQNFLPVIPDAYALLLFVLLGAGCAYAWLKLPYKLKLITLCIIVMMSGVYFYLRFHAYWAYAVKKHLGFCVPMIAVFIGLGAEYTGSKKNKMIKYLNLLVISLALIISAWAVWYTGVYWAGKEWYFDKDTMALMNAVESKVDKSHDHILVKAKKLRVSQFYLFRNWLNMTTYNIKGSEFAVIDDNYANNYEDDWLSNANTRVVLYKDSELKLIQK